MAAVFGRLTRQLEDTKRLPFDYAVIDEAQDIGVAELRFLAALGAERGCLAMPATQMPPPIGYICMLNDPDGNLVEFSYDQGVYERVREVWG